MAITDHFDTAGVETPLLDDVVEGAVDYKGQPVLRSSSGGWRSASFIIGKSAANPYSESNPPY